MTENYTDSLLDSFSSDLLSWSGFLHGWVNAAGSERKGKDNRRGGEAAAGQQQSRAPSAAARHRTSSGISSGSATGWVSQWHQHLAMWVSSTAWERREIGSWGTGEWEAVSRRRCVRGSLWWAITSVSAGSAIIFSSSIGFMSFNFYEDLLKVFCRSLWWAEVRVMGLNVYEYWRGIKPSEKEQL